MINKNKVIIIDNIIESAVSGFASGFAARHIGEKENPDGVINMKIHNPFIAALGDEILYYTALVRSLDSSLGNLIERMAIQIAKLSFDVYQRVEGVIYDRQIVQIAKLLEEYKSHRRKPNIEDYKLLHVRDGSEELKAHASDYYLKDGSGHYLIELKIGGDLDNKKVRSEKEALLEQYAILYNKLGSGANIKAFFATAYNRFGENEQWSQGRVLQFFSPQELLIGKKFWNFITKMENGYEVVINSYKKHSGLIRKALENIKKEYL
jgi:hypothetical protein